MRRILYALALVAVLAFAPPAWAASYTWTNANLCECWNVATNWTPNAAGGPTDGDVVTFDGNEAEGNLPDSQLLGGGNTVGFVFTAGYTLTINDLLNGAAIGAVTLNHTSADITAGANITGAITITSGTMAVSAARTLGSTVAIESNGTLGLDASGTVVASDTITMSAGSELYLVAGTTLDIAATKSLTGTALFISNGGIIQGTVNMTSCVWANVGTITVDEDGILNLGTDADNDQSVDVAADVTIGDHFTCLGFDGSSGVITGAAKTITVGSGGLTNGGATLDAVGTLNIIVAETPAAFDWAAANSNHSLGTLTVNAATTMTDTVFTTKVAGSAAIAVDARLYVRAMAADFWTNTATHSGSNQVRMYAYSGSHANTALINIGTCEFQVVGGDGTTTTLNGGLTCGVLDLDATAQNLVVNGPLSASGNTTLDDATLTLGSAATHSFGGTITSGSTGILIIDGTTTISGNVTTTGITVTVKAGSSTTLSGTAVWDNDGATEFEAGVTAFTVYGFTLSSGTLTGGGNTITVGAGGLSYVAGALDVQRTLNITFADTCSAQWASTASVLGTATLDTAGKTVTVGPSNALTCAKVTGSAGTFSCPTAPRKLFVYDPRANDFWSFTGTVSGYVSFLPLDDRSIATAVDFGGNVNLLVYATGDTLTLSSDLDCGTGSLTVRGGSAGSLTTLSIGGDLTCGNLVLGYSTTADYRGKLVLSSAGDHALSGTIASGHANDTANELDLAGDVMLGGDVTLAGITPDFGSAIIEASGDLTIDGTDAGTITNTDGIIFANGNTVTVDDLGYATTSAPIICVSCTPGGTPSGAGVEFQEPARMLMGIGF